MLDAMQMVGLAGAMMILVAYVGHQMRRMDANGWLYNVLNAVGGGILTYTAFHPFQAGFVVLEGTWTVVSLVAMGRVLRAQNLKIPVE